MQSSKQETLPTTPTFWQNDGSDSVFRQLYDLTDLKTYADNSKYIARMMYNVPFGNVTVIELSEIANGIDLCVKQPVEQLKQAEFFSPQRSLPFNQLCYFYVDSSAKAIKALFQKYNSGKQEFSYKCKACFDPISLKMEVYDHGQYSSLAKDNFTQQDSLNIESLLHLVHLTEKNGYRITVSK